LTKKTKQKCAAQIVVLNSTSWLRYQKAAGIPW